LTGTDAVELVPNSGWRPLSGAEAIIELRRGDGVWGWLVVTEDVSLPPIVRRRLETLGALASCAFDRLDDATPGGGEDAPSTHVGVREPARRTDAHDNVMEETDLGFYPSAPAVHDATFLNAVFPFALSQARRHGESLAVLCVAIDRLSGIRDLLGRDQVDRTVRHIGIKIATLIRSSDIVARLDDDRIMVLLPRAELADGLTVARKVCRGVADNASQLTDAPLLTLSIGVASHPASAANLYELLDAADAALSDAQAQGRNGVAAAPSLALEREGRRASCAV
jgi:diguanylate cyclase (GGDEF)-like protein